MDLFMKAKKVRLITFKDKYLTADDDEESVSQSRDRLSENAVWTVECEPKRNVVRLRSCFGKYLSASNMLIVHGHSGRRVVQIFPEKRTDVSIEWEPIRDGFQVRLKTLMGDFLRPHGGLPPWRNSITHDVPHLPKTREKLLWDIEVVEPRVDKFGHWPHIRRTQSDDSLSRFSRLKVLDVIALGR